MSSIRFPRKHIAESVVNRILNVADGLELDMLTLPGPSRVQAPPVATNVQDQGAALDTELLTPPDATVGIEQAPDPGGTVAGKPLLATMLDPKT